MSLKHKPRYRVMKILDKVDKLLKDGGEIFTSLHEFQKDPTTAGAVNVGIKLGRKALGLKAFDSYRPSNWEIFTPGESHFDSLLEILSYFPHRKQGESSDYYITFYEVHGITLAHEKNYRCFRFSASDTDPQQIHAVLSRIVWDHCGSPCLMRSKTSSKQDAWMTTLFEYAPAPKYPCLESELSSEVVRRLKAFLDKGHSRSAILFGPPGTGKSTIINNVASEIGKKVLTIDVSDLHFCSASTLAKRVSWLCPDVLVINDLDRFGNSERLLGAIEELHEHLKLLLVSVNDMEALPPAIRRPGRFDELFEVKTLDDAVIQSLLNIPKEKIPTSVYDCISQWPAAFIAELGKIISVLGEENLVEEFSKLQERVKKNQPEEEEEEGEKDDDGPKGLTKTLEAISAG